MTRRKARKIVRKKPIPKLDKEFNCPFCEHTKCVEVIMDRQRKIGTLGCRVCTTSFSTTISLLDEAVDVYATWIDRAVEANDGDQKEAYHREEADEYEDEEENSDKKVEDGYSQENKDDYDDYNNKNLPEKSKNKLLKQTYQNSDNAQDMFEDDDDEEDNENLFKQNNFSHNIIKKGDRRGLDNDKIKNISGTDQKYFSSNSQNIANDTFINDDVEEEDHEYLQQIMYESDEDEIISNINTNKKQKINNSQSNLTNQENEHTSSQTKIKKKLTRIAQDSDQEDNFFDIQTKQDVSLNNQQDSQSFTVYKDVDSQNFEDKIPIQSSQEREYNQFDDEEIQEDSSFENNDFLKEDEDHLLELQPQQLNTQVNQQDSNYDYNFQKNNNFINNPNQSYDYNTSEEEENLFGDD